MNAEMKDIHFQIPIELWEQFYKVFPDRGERKSILTRFIKEAIRLQSLKDYYLTVITKEVTMKMMHGVEDNEHS